MPFPLLPTPPRLVWNLVAIFPLHSPCLHPVVASTETSADINVFHCLHGHSNEVLLRETANSPGLELVGKLRPCTGCSMAKDHRKPIPNSTKLHATKKLGRVFVDLSVPKRIPSLSGARYVMLVQDDYSRHAWVYYLKHNQIQETYLGSFWLTHALTE